MKNIHGFSLLEILIALSIAAIITALSISSWNQFSQKSQAQVAMLQLQRAIALAREEAIARNEKITLCKSSDEKTCSGHWQDGFIIKTSTAVLQEFQALPDGILLMRAFPRGRDQLDFSSSGFPTVENGTFWYCSKHTELPSWALVLNRAGRVRIALTNSQGLILDDKGKSLVCAATKSW